MAIQFVLGTSGSGKTRWCINAVADALRSPDPRPLVLLVPEQATFQAEKAVLSCPGIAGYTRLQVLSFNRLQFWLCKNSPKMELSTLARRLLTQRAIGLCSEKLKILTQAASTYGISAALAQLFSRLHEDNCTPELLEQTATRILTKDPESLTGRKFMDISVIFVEYLKLLDRPGCDFLNSDALLTEARTQVRDAGFLKNACLWVDGFSGFTLQQRDILFEMLSVSSQSHIAFCLDPHAIDLTNTDPQKLDPLSLFAPTEQTYTEMLAIIKKCNMKLAEPVLLLQNLRFADTLSLQHIEKHFFDDPTPPAVCSGEGVEIYGLADARAEAFFAARKIKSVIRDGALRYRDCAVIVPQLEGYAQYLAGAFEQYKIPYFLDRPQTLRHHPLIELITLALQAIQGCFALSEMTALLKNELIALDRMESDILDNYCRAYGITAADWQTETAWDYGAGDSVFDTQQIDRLRKILFAPLSRLNARMHYPQAAITAKDCIRAIWDFLDELNIDKKVAALLAKDQPAAAEYHRQVWKKLIEVFDEISIVFESQAIAADQMLVIVQDALASMTLKQIPPTADQVLIGSIERSRHPDIKIAFLLGVTGKLFPVPLTQDELLTEQDSQLACDNDLPLSRPTELALSARRYLTYIARTRASQKMVLTFGLLDEKGGPVAYWQGLDRLCSLFSDLKIRYDDNSSERLDLLTPAALAQWFCKTLGPDNGADDDEKNRAIQTLSSLKTAAYPALVKLCDDVEYALAWRNEAAIDTGLTDRWIQWPMKASESRLTTFAACPFKHFAKYGLSLQYRNLLRLEPVDIGQLYHTLLSRLFWGLQNDNQDWMDVSPEQLLIRCQTIADQLQEQDPKLAAFVRQSRQNQYVLAQAVEKLKRFIPAMRDLSAAGKFRQCLAEAKFGDTPDATVLAIDKNKSVSLIGRIDRLDCADIDGTLTGVVFDYKTSPQTLNWSEFYNGLDLQLATYLLAIQNHPVNNRKIEAVAGAFYLPIEIKLSLFDPAKSDPDEQISSLKARGVFNGRYVADLDTQCEKHSDWYSFTYTKDNQPYSHYGQRDVATPEDFAVFVGHAETMIRTLAAGIAKGDIRVYPYRLGTQSPCSYCDYKPVCKFDWQINEYRNLPKLNKTQTLEILAKGDVL